MRLSPAGPGSESRPGRHFILSKGCLFRHIPHSCEDILGFYSSFFFAESFVYPLFYFVTNCPDLRENFLVGSRERCWVWETLVQFYLSWKERALFTCQVAHRDHIVESSSLKLCNAF